MTGRVGEIADWRRLRRAGIARGWAATGIGGEGGYKSDSTILIERGALAGPVLYWPLLC